MLWIKALHLLAVIAWLAGIFYLPRIFVHYAEGQSRAEDVRRLVIMARRLFGFMTLMALFALAFGLTLWLGFHDSGRWLMVKLLFVLGLIGYHLACRSLVGRLKRGEPMPSPGRLRLFNEGALLLVVPIILLAVVKPF
jgi:putative membrane protein